MLFNLILINLKWKFIKMKSLNGLRNKIGLNSKYKVNLFCTYNFMSFI